MSFKFMTWNVRHFKGSSEKRIKEVDAHIGAEGQNYGQPPINGNQNRWLSRVNP